MEDVKRYVKAYASVATLSLGTTMWLKDLTSGTINVYSLSGGGEDKLIAADVTTRNHYSTMEF